MNAIASHVPPRAPSTPRLLLAEARYEFLRVLRTPAFAIPALSFPLLFYLLFGVLLNRGNPQAARYLLATYGVFGTMAPALFAFGVGFAVDRERGLLALKRAQPVPGVVLLGARLLMAMLFALEVALLLLAAGALLGGVVLHAGQYAWLLAIDVAGALPFCALGLFIGGRVGGAAAPGVVNLVYLPMALLSGLWLPLSMLPPLFSTLAPAWPSWHLAQLALQVMGLASAGGAAMHLGVLVLWTAVFFALALRRLRRA
ncbi:ABC transporter permease [Xanthomonas massiliensis]|uniref:ABC transporter permease n=1 Tax=Xanthomonas massiliensis TaxID=1720302 RepID=UPI000826EDBB|nr:ABC transporter permease [Xanthomonas massiliensis]